MGRVFLVDDDAGLRALYRRVLVAAGHIVVGEGEARSSLLEEILASKPEVVVLDLTMPGGSGLDYVEDLTEAGISVLVISGGARGGWVSKAFALGAVDVLPKPVGAAQLTAGVQRTLDLRDSA